MDVNETKHIAALEKLFSDHQPVQLMLSKQTLWEIIAAVQLACRHPQFTGPVRDRIEENVRAIGAALIADHPDLEWLLEYGWRGNCDRN